MSDADACSPSIIDIVESIPWGGQEHVVPTSFGPVSVLVCGDQTKPALITYPDVALNYMSCFQGLLFYPEAASLLFHNFCIYHIDAPGHELGAASIPPQEPFLTVEDLADQVNEVLDYFGLQCALCMGVMAGAYILTLLALRHPERVHGLILVSPLCRAPSWSEWAYNKLMVNVLYFYGMCSLVKDTLLQRYFSQALRVGTCSESEIVQACRRLLDERQSENIMRFIQAVDRRKDITREVKKLGCRTLVFAGEQSPFYNEALHLAKEMNHSFVALVEVEGCGSLVTEEQPQAILAPLEYFLTGYGLYRPLPILHPQQDYSQYYHHHPYPYHQNTADIGNFDKSASACGHDNVIEAQSYSSVVGPHCISPDLLSPQSLGLKLKPIKTRPSSPPQEV